MGGERTAVILQPGYLPWLGFFEQMDRADVFVFYDDVQFDRSWRARNRVKGPNGPVWLSVPVHASLGAGTTVKETRIDNRRDWRRKHWRTIEQSYAKAPYWGTYRQLFEDLYTREWEWLTELDLYAIERLRDALGLRPTPLLRGSELGVDGDRVGRLIAICKEVGANVFYEGAAGWSYIDPAVFAAEGIRVAFQEYRHPEYRQQHGAFVPYLSAVDLLLNEGENSARVLRSGVDG